MTGPATDGRSAQIIRILPSVEDIARVALGLFVDCVLRAVRTSGMCSVALSGGLTPPHLFRLLACETGRSDRESIPWPRVRVFWGDERHVPATHADSNYRMARETLLDHVPIPAAQIYRIPAENPDADAAARAYEQTLREALALTDGQLPAFDLMLLGMGADGHTASLFPGSPALNERRRLVVAPWVEKLGAFRITLTPVALTGAETTIVMVAGAEKAAILPAVLHGPEQPDVFPVQCLRQARHPVTWLIDQAAATHLS